MAVENLYLLQGRVTQLFCLNDESLKRNAVKRGENFHGPQGRALLPPFYHSDGSLAVACIRRNFDLLDPLAFPQRSERLAKRLLEREGRRFREVGHVSIFRVDATS